MFRDHRGQLADDGTIALGVWAVDSGRVVPDPGGITDVTLDVPSGRVVARVRTRAGQVTGVDFVNVPSYALAAGIETQTSRGRVSVGIGYGGAIYARVRAADAGLAVEPGNVNERNVTIFADGQLDRSPCGSGSASRVAVLAASGALKPGKNLVHDSIVGSRFVCTVAGQTTVDGFDAVIPAVTGVAYRYGSSRFTVDPRDPLVKWWQTLDSTGRLFAQRARSSLSRG